VTRDIQEYPGGVCGTAREAPTGSLSGDPSSGIAGTPHSEDAGGLVPSASIERDRVFVALDPVASTDQLSILIFNASVPVAILSRREVLRLKHQIDRWLNWDRATQGTPRTYRLEAKDICHRSGRHRRTGQ